MPAGVKGRSICRRPANYCWAACAVRYADLSRFEWGLVADIQTAGPLAPSGTPWHCKWRTRARLGSACLPVRALPPKSRLPGPMPGTANDRRKPPLAHCLQRQSNGRPGRKKLVAGRRATAGSQRQRSQEQAAPGACQEVLLCERPADPRSAPRRAEPDLKVQPPPPTALGGRTTAPVGWRAAHAGLRIAAVRRSIAAGEWLAGPGG